MRRKLGEITRKDVERGGAKGIMKRLIVQHQKIIAFSQNIETLYSNIALIQFVSNTIIICCLGFLIVIVSKLNSSLYLSLKRIYVILGISVYRFTECVDDVNKVRAILRGHQLGCVHLLLRRRIPQYEGQYVIGEKKDRDTFPSLHY